jgi:hypothetical protein
MNLFLGQHQWPHHKRSNRYLILGFFVLVGLSALASVFSYGPWYNIWANMVGDQTLMGIFS